MRILLTGASGFIGTNLVERLLEEGHVLTDLSMTPPLNPGNLEIWHQVDILDLQGMQAAFTEFQPEAVIHLAARAECDENTTLEAGYRQNTDGTRHVLAAVKNCPSVRRLIVTSSQFVCGPGYFPKNDEDYAPATIYGESKVITEQLTRQADLACIWTIIRPTNIWGPWHLRYQREFWHAVQKGYYLHPGGAPVVRCYGYVGNVVEQMLTILNSPPELVHRRTFYLGDAPDDIRKWVDAFSMALRGRKAATIPRWLLKTLGAVGDLISRVTGRPFYITSSRARSMTSDYVVSMDQTFAALGQPRFSLEEGVKQTVAWLKRDAQ